MSTEFFLIEYINITHGNHLYIIKYKFKMDDALPNILKSKIPKRRNAIFETKLAKMTQVKLKIPRFKSKKLN